MAPAALEGHVRSAVIKDWQAEPFSSGAYSYVPVGAITAPITLAEPVANTLFFAGEATNSEGASATVHGAIATGYRAADQILGAERRHAA
jgi:monoamine oxidase